MKWLILILTCALAMPSFAAKVCGTVEETNLHMVYHNGMSTTKRNALINVDSLYYKAETAIGDEINQDTLQVHLAFNYPEDMLGQIVEVVEQWRLINSGRFIRWFNGGYDPDESELENYRGAFVDMQGRLLYFDESEDQISHPITGELISNDYTTQVELYKTLLQDDSVRLISVAHSQGNMYLQAIYTNILYGVYDEKYKLLSLASPISITGYHYYLMDDYDIIKRLPFNPEVNSYNTENSIFNAKGISIKDLKSQLIIGHAFSSYLNGSDSGRKIDEYLKLFVEDFYPGDPTIAFRITLDKNGNSDAYLGILVSNSSYSTGFDFIGSPESSINQYFPKAAGDIKITDSYDQYILRCEDLPYETTVISAGVQNYSSEESVVNMTVISGDGQFTISERDLEVGIPDTLQVMGGAFVEFNKDTGEYIFMVE